MFFGQVAQMTFEEQEETKQVVKTLIERGRLLRDIKDISDNAQMPCALWGSYFYRDAVTIITGDPGIGKTTICYLFAINVSEGQSFLNIAPLESLKIAYFDFESSDSLIKLRSVNFNLDRNYPNFKIFNYHEFSYEDLEDSLELQFKYFPFDVFFIDNMLTAFNTFDENDNAEAKKKVQKVRKLAEKLHCSIVVMHHPSKANMEGTRKGSGAYAWARHADILINFNKTDDEDVIEIEMSKNRWSGDKPTIYIRKDSEYHLTLTNPPIVDKRTSSDYKIIARTIILYNGSHSRKDIYDWVQSQCGNVNTRSFDRVLKYLVDKKAISKDGHYGEYQISQRK